MGVVFHTRVETFQILNNYDLIFLNKMTLLEMVSYTVISTYQ